MLSIARPANKALCLRLLSGIVSVPQAQAARLHAQMLKWIIDHKEFDAAEFLHQDCKENKIRYHRAEKKNKK
jgi:hypothetical protein